MVESRNAATRAAFSCNGSLTCPASVWSMLSSDAITLEEELHAATGGSPNNSSSRRVRLGVRNGSNDQAISRSRDVSFMNLSWCEERRASGEVGQRDYNPRTFTRRNSLMTRDLRFAAAVLATAVLLLGSSCSHATNTTATPTAERPRQQENFGVEMARMNLWREAMFRFQRAIDINPGDAMAHNNLAVAYEA